MGRGIWGLRFGSGGGWLSWASPGWVRHCPLQARLSLELILDQLIGEISLGDGEELLKEGAAKLVVD